MHSQLLLVRQSMAIQRQAMPVNTVSKGTQTLLKKFQKASCISSVDLVGKQAALHELLPHQLKYRPR